MELGKGTKAKRRYEDACGAAHALEIVGERWALLIVRELMFGPKWFGNIRFSLPGLSANVLTQELQDKSAIIEWINKHLSIRWLQLSPALLSAEKMAIRRNRPLLNTDHNPEPVRALAELRETCRELARASPTTQD